MNAINPYQSSASELNPSQLGQTKPSQQAANTDSTSQAAPENKNAINQYIHLSERGKKLQSINAQFFHNNKISFEQLPSYINALHKNGLINADQYQHLKTQNPATEQPSGGTSLSGFVTELHSELKKENPDHQLLAPLQLTASLFDQLEQGKAINNEDVKQAQYGFNQFFASDEFNTLTPSAQQGLLKINDTLGLIAVQGPSANDKTNAYKTIANLS
ncbi:hypothetical protein PULV_a2428 [Pseudoalteromonas ulvae UL12]|uniref:hypothetical protein n=1 Tax=Pseudoalteromonas ulvae TaxID=107327 RepID=UPI00186B857B|nr:hypothetical protein [Pseudoalteromonas ulvae]MBE0364683.1 hypothetical protein [Pseudoalteromonas ulvae UL12]